jgi:transposase InsO family protein
VFPGLPNISSAGSPISLPNIIILGVYPVLLFTEDLSAPANCGFQVFTDQGRNFESSLFREMCELLHIHKARTTPYRPSANGQVERCNRTLMAAVRCFIGKKPKSRKELIHCGSCRFLCTLGRQGDALYPLGKLVNHHQDVFISSLTTPYRPSANGQVERCNRTLMAAVQCFIGKNQRSWDKYLPQLAGALRSSVNRSTGYTPNMMMLGREIGSKRTQNSSPDQ